MPKHKELDDETKARYRMYGNNFRKARKKLKLTQKEIADRSNILRDKVDASRLEKGDTSIWFPMRAHEIIDLCKIYEISIDEAFKENADLLSDVMNNEIITNEDLENEDETNKSKLTTDTRSGYFQGYLGEFYCYFHSTAKENRIIRGKLIVEANENNVCMGTLVIDVKKLKSEDDLDEGKFTTNKDDEYLKTYKGEVIYSSQRKTAYFILKNEKIGEFVIMHCYQPDLNIASINECRMANVISASAGVGGRHPVMFNMLITSKELTEDQIDDVKSLLPISNNFIVLDNDADIPEDVLNATKIKLDKYHVLSVEKFSLNHFRDFGITNYDETAIQTYLLKALDASINSDIVIDLDEKIDRFLHKRLFEKE